MDLQVTLHMLVGDMILLYLFIEGEQVLDLDISQGLDEPLVAGIVYTYVFMYLCLAFFINFREQIGKLIALVGAPHKIFNQSSLACLLNGA